MTTNENRDYAKEELYAKAVRAGKRTYFFDVKQTRSGDKFMTITESKRRFDNDNGKFAYEKHKLFLFQEDFEKFIDGFQHAVDFIDGKGNSEDEDFSRVEKVEFEDLDKLGDGY